MQIIIIIIVVVAILHTSNPSFYPFFFQNNVVHSSINENILVRTFKSESCIYSLNPFFTTWGERARALVRIFYTVDIIYCLGKFYDRCHSNSDRSVVDRKGNKDGLIREKKKKKKTQYVLPPQKLLKDEKRETRKKKMWAVVLSNHACQHVKAVAQNLVLVHNDYRFCCACAVVSVYR